MSDEYVNSVPVMIALTAVFWLTMAAIGYGMLKLKDNKWRFSIGMLLAAITAVAILCVWTKLMLIVPK
jgi:hypothetical protein